MWNYFSELVPIKKCQKFRRDSEFTIVTNMSNKFLYLNNTCLLYTSPSPRDTR